MNPKPLLHLATPFDPALFPHACEPLEEVGAAAPGDVGAALGFSIARLAARGDGRPVALVTTDDWLRERGRPFAGGIEGWGLAADRLVWVKAQREGEALWALEEVLKSGAAAGALATVAAPPFVTTRRLEFAARAGSAAGILLRAGETGDLSAARRRWRIGAATSGEHAFDGAAPGSVRLRAELVRRRDGPPGAWTLEQDDETGRLRVDAGLADLGLDAAEPDPGGSRPARAAA
jgi:protein ImuA